MKKQALVAAACAVALTLGTAGTAFAATTVDGTSSFKNADNKAITNVKVTTVVGQIDATVPLNMAVAAKASGGDFSDVPTSGAYKIENNSSFGIKVATATAEAKADWELYGEKLDDKSTSTKAMGSIQLILTPSADQASTVAWNVKNPFVADTAAWKVPAKTDSGAGALKFDITGSTSPLKKTLADDALSEAVTLTYTIAADSTAPSPTV